MLIDAETAKRPFTGSEFLRQQDPVLPCAKVDSRMNP
jgi:hypothetical protein